MSSRAKMKKFMNGEANHVEKGFDEVAERIFRDDSPGESLYAILGEDEAAEEAA
jgi:hypothetical protein